MKTTLDGLSNLKKESLTDRIYDEILAIILRNGQEKELLLTEGCLVEKFGVSKAPVREALIRLCNENVLRCLPRCGYMVVQMGEKEAREVTEIRVLLETEALRAGFENIVSSHLEEIRQQIEKKEADETVGDTWRIWEENAAFHLLLASFAGNQTLNRFLKESLQMQKRICAQLHCHCLYTVEKECGAAPHRKVYEALCQRDLEKSVRTLQEDIRT